MTNKTLTAEQAKKAAEVIQDLNETESSDLLEDVAGGAQEQDQVSWSISYSTASSPV
ncbi:hypothetical protein [Pseudoalteromonas denitrificans]|jgi:hypothetical protein|uniref:Uncharacterized protein n=1 Tax=Pseudoalteromonas denitrificans DSM 6059 TaxID=1123010 RepID=A0A1I1JKW9_9GAMM|nr:hypothetical protein [Pseudoalteromonas denitrificans]SFC48632.1 hypothetical protein SAMN02745724_01778 [Pseudoalteromonas denitrificans DSM 6059]